MASAYSYDFRQKVMEAIELDGMPKIEASQTFHISRNTINLWRQRKAETGDVRAKPHKPSGNPKITDWEKFREFAKANGDKTQAEMAELWPGEISRRSIGRGLKKIGFTRKKKRTATENAMSKSEQNSEPSWLS